MNAEMHAPASQTRLGIAILHHAVFLQLAAGHGAMLMDLMMVLVELVLPHAELETNQEAAMMGVGPAGMKHKAAILQNAVSQSMVDGATGADGAMLMDLMMALVELVLPHAELDNRQGQ